MGGGPITINSQMLMFLLSRQQKFLECLELPGSAEYRESRPSFLLGFSLGLSSHSERVIKRKAGKSAVREGTAPQSQSSCLKQRCGVALPASGPAKPCPGIKEGAAEK